MSSSVGLANTGTSSSVVVVSCGEVGDITEVVPVITSDWAGSVFVSAPVTGSSVLGAGLVAAGIYVGLCTSKDTTGALTVFIACWATITGLVASSSMSGAVFI